MNILACPECHYPLLPGRFPVECFFRLEINGKTSISGCFFGGGGINAGWRDKNTKKNREKAKCRAKFYKTFEQF